MSTDPAGSDPLSPDGAPGYTHLLVENIWPRVKDNTPNGVRAKPAATLILIDRSGKHPKVLMGRRNPNNKFMPDKFVFPGGQLDAEDRLMPASGVLADPVEQRLSQVRGRINARAIAMAGIRETFEETGLILGASAEDEPVSAPGGGWSEFAAHGQLPNLEAIHFVGRAITPPRLPRRFDTIFLAAEATDVTASVDGTIGPDKELVELAWIPMQGRAHHGRPSHHYERHPARNAEPVGGWLFAYVARTLVPLPPPWRLGTD